MTGQDFFESYINVGGGNNAKKKVITLTINARQTDQIVKDRSRDNLVEKTITVTKANDMNNTSDIQAHTFNLPVFQERINGETVQTVNARDLHSELGSKRQFTNWIDKRIEKYGFVEGEDFLTNLLKTSTGGRPTKEYHISFDMAKELAMVEANDKGQQLRRYFIQKEKEARLLTSSGNSFIAPVLQDCVNIAQIFGLTGNQALLSAARATETLTGHNPIKLLGVDLKADRKEKTYTVTEMGREFYDGMSPQKLNRRFEAAGLQNRVAGQWELTEAGKEHAEVLDTGKKRSTGTPVKQIKWFKTVVEEI